MGNYYSNKLKGGLINVKGILRSVGKILKKLPKYLLIYIIGDRFFIKNNKMVDDLDICVIRKSKASSIDNFMAYYEELINLKQVKKSRSDKY